MNLKINIILVFLLLFNLSLISSYKSNNINLKKAFFIENKGQFNHINGNDVLFKSSFGNINCYFTKNGISFLFTKYVEEDNQSNNLFVDNKSFYGCNFFDKVKIKIYRIDLELLNSNPDVNVYGIDKNRTKFNYYSAEYPEGILDVDSYNKIIYENIYPNINLLIYIDNNNLKYEYIVKQGGNPSDIRFRYNGAEKVSLEDENIHIITPLGEIKENKPISFQGSQQLQVKSKFVLNNNGVISFALGNYNLSQELTIDPEIIWSLYFGSVLNDFITDLTVDREGNIFITGFNNGDDALNNKLTTSGVEQEIFAGQYDAFCAKVIESGEMIWATYYGGANIDFAFSIAVGQDGNPVIVGSTNSVDLPGKENGTVMNKFGGYVNDFDPINAPGAPVFAMNGDAFIVKFNSTSGRKIWMSYIGGSNNENAQKVVIDYNDNIYFIGCTRSNDFPLKGNIFQNRIDSRGKIQYYIDTSQFYSDVYLVKLDGNGKLIFSTYLGGEYFEDAQALALDKFGNIFIGGLTISQFFPTTYNAFQPMMKYRQNIYLNYEGFITKFDSNGYLLWSTYIGDTLTDIVLSLAIDSSNNIYFAGSTDSPEFPITSDAEQKNIGAAYTTFIGKFTPFYELKWCTFFGGSGNENWYSYMSSGFQFLNLLVDYNQNIWVNGVTESKDFKTTNDAFYKTFQGGRTDAYFLRLDSNGKKHFLTYFGNDQDDASRGAGLNLKGAIVSAGATTQLGNNYLIGNINKGKGGVDGFIVTIGINSGIINTLPLSLSEICPGDTLLISYQTDSYFLPNNIFSVQISDSLGNFSENSQVIGSLNSDKSGVIKCYIPLNFPPGTGYLVRVISNLPLIYGSDNKNKFTIKELPYVSLDIQDTVCIDQPKFKLEGGKPQNGTYSGKSVFDDYFDPSVAGLGKHLITYSYTNIKGCTNHASKMITVVSRPDKPKITFDGVKLISSSTRDNQWFYESTIIKGANSIEYIPDKPGNYSVQVVNTYNCNSEMSDFFFYNPDEFATLSFGAEGITGNTGSIINIPIFLKKNLKFENYNINSISATLKVNATVLSLLNNSFYQTIFEDKRFINIKIYKDNFNNSPVLNIPVIITLGNDSGSVLEIENITTEPDTLKVYSIPGKLKVQNICYDGGARLVKSSGQVQILQIKPNPVAEKAEIEIEVVEPGVTQLSLYNSFGQKVTDILNGEIPSGRHKFIANLQDIASGSYFVMLKTLTQRRVMRMDVVK